MGRLIYGEKPDPNLSLFALGRDGRGQMRSFETLYISMVLSLPSVIRNSISTVLRLLLYDQVAKTRRLAWP